MIKHNPIQTMLEEHEIICNTESIIESLDHYWATYPEEYAEIITTLIAFFREYADGYHHHKEEDVLFPAIKNHPDFVLQEIITEFEQHHDDFRDYTKEIEEAITEGNYEKSYQELNNYLQDLLDHIAAENDELFVLAETLLEEEDLETIFFKFKDIDMELGIDRKTELEENITSLRIAH
jgi:hemerythrin-like domain-containing protein